MTTSTLAPTTPATTGERVLPPLRIGRHVIDSPVVLAPMAGITNRAFRRLCREAGDAGLLCFDVPEALRETFRFTQGQYLTLRALLDGLARRMEPQARERGLTLHVGGHGHADVDASALERAVTNLTENALRYARHEVRLTAAPGLLTVQDDGPGLSASLDDLAQPFNAQPAVIAGQQYTAGTAGLGLFIVRRIAEAHGGTLRYAKHASASTGTPLRAAITTWLKSSMDFR